MSLNHLSYESEYDTPYLKLGGAVSDGFVNDFRLYSEENNIGIRSINGGTRLSSYNILSGRFTVRSNINAIPIDLNDDEYIVGSIYDVFIKINQNDAVLKTSVWDGRFRFGNLININGIYFNPAAEDEIYLGSFYVRDEAGDKRVLEHERFRDLYNQFNQKAYSVKASYSANHIYGNSSVWRKFYDSDVTRVTFLLGMPQTVLYTYGGDFVSTSQDPQSGMLSLGVNIIGVTNILPAIEKATSDTPNVEYSERTYTEETIEGFHECWVMQKLSTTYPLSLDYREGKCSVNFNI